MAMPNSLGVNFAVSDSVWGSREDQIRRGSPREGWGCDSEDGQTDTGLERNTDMVFNAHHSGVPGSSGTRADME